MLQNYLKMGSEKGQLDASKTKRVSVHLSESEVEALCNLVSSRFPGALAVKWDRKVVVYIKPEKILRSSQKPLRLVNMTGSNY